MTVYQKVAGVWQAASLVYVKVNGVHTLVDDAYVKIAGVWTNSFHYDVTPPPPPEIVVSIVDVLSGGKVTGSHLSVGVRQPGVSNNVSIRRIRVLTTYAGTFPTSQFGGTYTSQPTDVWPNEPWSEWRFNDFGDHNDTSLLTYKKWPLNAPDSSDLVPGQVYRFSAWSEDFSGNWSPVTSTQITAPKAGVDAANLIYKVARFQANSGGTNTGTTHTPGRLYQSGSPWRLGSYFYGPQIPEAIGQNGVPTVTSAQILVSRYDDAGTASANVYCYWHTYQTPADIVFPAVVHNTSKLGTVAKGESKWFALPDAFLTALEANTIRGFGFHNHDPVKASAFADDYSELKSITDNMRAGEVAVTWYEKL